MKKTLLLIATVAFIALTLTVNAFAYPGAFVESPSNNGAPAVDSSVNESEDCEATVTVIAYKDRDSLEVADKATIEAAYSSVLDTTNGSAISMAFATLSSKLGNSANNLSVSDLFYMDCSDCETHENHGSFTVNLSSATFENFAGIAHFDGTKWTILEDASINDKGQLEVVTDVFGTFAVIVRDDIAADSDTTTAPPAGSDDEEKDGNSLLGVVIAEGVAIVALGAGFAAYAVVTKKKSDNQ